jgi:hypothetical protein
MFTTNTGEQVQECMIKPQRNTVHCQKSARLTTDWHFAMNVWMLRRSMEWPTATLVSDTDCLRLTIGDYKNFALQNL